MATTTRSRSSKQQGLSEASRYWLVKSRSDTIANVATQHAFVMLGTKRLFLSHLTMYGGHPDMEPHMYQIILEATLPDWADETYRKQRRQHPTETYFLGNSPNDLLTMPKLNSRARTWFLADVFRGIPQQNAYMEWPWKGRRGVIESVRIEINRIVHYRLFALNMDYPPTLTYFIFGAGDEAHMTNWQTKEPDFDHVLSLGSVPSWVGQHELESGILIDFPNIPRVPQAGKVHCRNPLPAGSNQVRYRGSPPLRTIQVGPTFWFCTRVANMNNPCPASCPACGSAYHP